MKPLNLLLIISFHFLFLIISINTYAQNASLDWAIGMGGIGNDAGRKITVDELGNVYTVGFFKHSVDFEPGPDSLYLNAEPGTDMFVMKTDVNGNLVWVKQIANNSSGVHCRDMVRDDENNIYVCGTHGGITDFDPGSDTFDVTATDGAFILKLNKDGEFIWVKSFEGADGVSISIFEENLFISGDFIDTVDFDTGPQVHELVSTYNTVFHNFMNDPYILKLNLDGEFIWAKSFGAEDSEITTTIRIDGNGDIICTGLFMDSIDVHPGPENFYLYSEGFLYSSYILKLSSEGEFIWAIPLVGNDNTVINNLAFDHQNNIYIAGAFAGETDFDPGIDENKLTSNNLGFNNGFTDIFLLKLNENGDFVWVKQIGDVGDDSANSIFFDGNEYIYAGGFFSGPGAGIDFNPGSSEFLLSSLGPATECFILKLDLDGNFTFAKAFRGGNNDVLSDVWVDSNSNIYSTGLFWQQTDFDPNAGTSYISATGFYDIFVVKFKQCESSTISIFESACDSFLYDEQVYMESGSYTHFFTNSGECDSIVTLNLTIGEATYNSIFQEACEMYDWLGQTYSESGSYVDTIFGGKNDCDSIITLNLTIVNFSTSIQEETACDNYLWNENILTSSGVYMDTIFGGNIQGCDSVRILDLKIVTLDNSISFTDSSLISNEGAANYQWVSCPDFIPEPKQTGQEFQPPTTGGYAVIISNGECTDTSDCTLFTITPSSARTINEDIFSMYPIPFENEIIVESPKGTGIFEVVIYNSIGQVVAQHKSPQGNKISLLTSGLPFGGYYARIRSKKGEVFRKLIK